MQYFNISMWNSPHRRLGYYCHHPRTNTQPYTNLTYTFLDHCRPAYLIQYNSSPEMRELSCTFIHWLLSLCLLILHYLIFHHPAAPVIPIAFSPSWSILLPRLLFLPMLPHLLHPNKGISSWQHPWSLSCNKLFTCFPFTTSKVFLHIFLPFCCADPTKSSDPQKRREIFPKPWV